MTTEYALRVMAAMAMSPESLVPTSTLASLTKVPSNYLAKVLQQLASANLVTGRRGVGGGYKLARPATDIRLLEIIHTVGNLQRITSCPLGLASHGPNLCPLHKTMDHAAEVLMNLFDGVSLQSLVDDPNYPNKPLCESTNITPLTLDGLGRVSGVSM
ncbi:MAG: Rrf2 family transcriptional regulator [Phycisphaerales bacterium]